MSRKKYWSDRAEKLSIDDLAKDLHPAWDSDIKSFYQHSEIKKEALDILKANTNMELVLDFGTGLGRNQNYLKTLFNKVHGYDIPSMIERGKSLTSIDIDLYTSNWNFISAYTYDLVYECVCFQHMDLDELKLSLSFIANISQYLYINTRSYNDVGRNWDKKSGGTNILKLILGLELYDIVYTDTDQNLAISLEDESHYQVLLRSKKI